MIAALDPEFVEPDRQSLDRRGELRRRDRMPCAAPPVVECVGLLVQRADAQQHLRQRPKRRALAVSARDLARRISEGDSRSR